MDESRLPHDRHTPDPLDADHRDKERADPTSDKKHTKYAMVVVIFIHSPCELCNRVRIMISASLFALSTFLPYPF